MVHPVLGLLEFMTFLCRNRNKVTSGKLVQFSMNMVVTTREVFIINLGISVHLNFGEFFLWPFGAIIIN
jgi:hypothetical protein